MKTPMTNLVAVAALLVSITAAAQTPPANPQAGAEAPSIMPAANAAIPAPAAPSPQYFLAVTSYSITASWSENEHVSGALYQVDISSTGGSPTSLIILSTTAFFGGLSPATVYHLRVWAGLAGGVLSEVVSFSTATLPAGAEPEHLQPTRAAAVPSAPPHLGIWVVRGNPCWVQVGAYRDSAQAQVLADGLSASGHKVIVSDAQAGEVIMHKVRIGPFETWRAARDEADRLAAYKTLDQLAASLKK